MPVAGLIDVNGILYGTTSYGGTHTCDTEYEGCGTVFSITLSGKETVLYDFGKASGDGIVPLSALLNVGGTLYGTTSECASSHRGTVFSITTAGQYRTVYTFGTTQNDGAGPRAALIDVNGRLYGTTSGDGGTTASGGANNYSTVFSISKTDTETVVHSFAKGDGVKPFAGVIAVDHTLYGTTYGSTTYGAKRSFGNVFSLTP